MCASVQLVSNFIQVYAVVLVVLQSRWARSKSRERRHKSPGRQDSTGTDYAADLSSDHSSPSTQSPRHRLHTYTGLLLYFSI